MAAVKRQKHLSVSFTTKRKIIPLKCRHIKNSTSSIVRTVQLAKKVNDNSSFDLCESPLVLPFTITQLKNNKIQTSSITN